MPFPLARRVGVYADGDRLTRAHFRELGFLEIGDNPDLIGNDGQQRHTGLNVLTGLDDFACDSTCFRGDDRRVRQGDLRQLHLRLGLGHAGLGGLHLGLAVDDLGLGSNQTGLCSPHGGVGGVGLGAGLKQFLFAGSTLTDGIEAFEILLGKALVGLSSGNIRLGLFGVGLENMNGAISFDERLCAAVSAA